MIGIDYIKPWVISGGYRYCYRQRQVTRGAGEAGVAMSQMSNNKEASRELPQDYLIDYRTTQILYPFYSVVDIRPYLGYY